MKKTIIVKLIVATLLVCASVTALTACSNAGYGDYSIEPIHTYEMIVANEYLVSEATCTKKAVYYYSCICGKKGTDTFEYGVVKEHEYSSDWAYDEDNHWHECFCGATTQPEKHEYENGECKYCGKKGRQTLVATEGLEYTLNSYGTSYSCAGLGSATATDIVIADVYNGLPVTSIGNYAFSGCSGLQSITIPDSVRSIGDNAFNGCSGLTSIVIPDSVTSIGDNAFFGCTGLTSIVIPDSVTSIGNNAFSGCTGLTSVNYTGTIDQWVQINFRYVNSFSAKSNPLCYARNLYINNQLVTTANITSAPEISSLAFVGYDNLTSVTIPDSVTSIGVYAFSGCNKLVEVINYSSLNITKGSSDYGDAGYYALNVKQSRTSDIVNKDGFLFYTYGNVNYLVNYIGTNTELVLPNNYNGQRYEIYKYVFYHCDNITSVTIPDSVTSIGEHAFSWCSGLTNVTIGNSVTSIGNHAFSWCTGLTSVTISNSVTSIVERAFFACDELESIIVSPNNQKYYSKNNCLIEKESKTLILGCKNSIIPTDGSVTSIGEHAFSACHNLTSITIPDSVTSIGSSAFNECHNLTSITIPDSVTSIGWNAFRGCTNLTDVNYTGTIDQWVQIEFSSGPSHSFYYNPVTGNPLWAAKNLYINNRLVTEANITSATKINDYAFYNCTSLTSVTIGNSVTSIGNYAFSDCYSLTSVTIGNSVTSIGDYAFRDCTSLTNVTIPDSVTSIGDYAFYGCTSLTSVTIGNSVTSIGEYAFRGCTSLTNVTIGNSVTSIGDYAFRDCTSLTNVTIPDSVTSIGYHAFRDCTSLTSVTIGNSVTSIDGVEFVGCTSLTNVTIPDSVTYIDYAAFYGCTSLTKVYYEGTATEWENIAINSYYKINATRYYYSESQPTTSGNYWHYDENGDVVEW